MAGAGAVAAPGAGTGRRRGRGDRVVDLLATGVDAGYAGWLVTFAGRVWRVTLAVVRRADDQVGFKVLHRRWVVERTLAWISKHRRCVRDYESRLDTSEAMVHVALIMTMSRRLARQR